MHWPAGTAVDPHSHDRLVAFHVVSGELVESRLDRMPVTRTTHPEGATVVEVGASLPAVRPRMFEEC